MRSLNIEKHILDEKKVMELCNHPLIMTLYSSFTDEYNVYFLLSYISGMELFDAIREIGLLSVDQSSYFTGCLLS